MKRTIPCERLTIDEMVGVIAGRSIIDRITLFALNDGTVFVPPSIVTPPDTTTIKIPPLLLP